MDYLKSTFPDNNNIPKPPIHSSLLQSSLGRQMATKTYGSDITLNKKETSHLYIKDWKQTKEIMQPRQNY